MASFLDLAPFVGRDHLGRFLWQQRLVGDVVEIGTHRGAFAVTLRETWQDGTLHCVDGWQSGYDDDDPASGGDRAADYRAAREVLAPYGKRVQIYRLLSAEAVLLFADESLACVYVDGCHQPAQVRKDLRLWWPKLAKGGLLAGHDFLCPGENEGGWAPAVQAEVLRFAREQGVRVWLIPEPLSVPWSFYLIKGGP